MPGFPDRSSASWPKKPEPMKETYNQPTLGISSSDGRKIARKVPIDLKEAVLLQKEINKMCANRTTPQQIRHLMAKLPCEALRSLHISEEELKKAEDENNYRVI
eukprot:8656001-Karenia_brevis.AAC.1